MQLTIKFHHKTKDSQNKLAMEVSVQVRTVTHHSEETLKIGGNCKTLITPK